MNCWPSGLLPGKYFFGEVLVDDHDARRVDAIAVGEECAREERNAHRAEVVAADDLLSACGGVAPGASARPTIL